MANIDDVAAYLLKKTGEITTWKFQKLIYYCQAWNLVWDEKPLFDNEIQAWANGPVVYELYRHHKGDFWVNSWDGNPNRLTKDERETIDAVVKFYSQMSSQELRDLICRERPWRKAREGIPSGDRSTAKITIAEMADYYGGIDTE